MRKLTRDEKIVIGGLTGLVLVLIVTGKKVVPGKSPKTNQGYIDTLHPKYKKRFVDFIDHLQRLGWKVQINSSYRDFAKQARLKKEDKRNASPGFSPHNYGEAIDIQVTDKFGKLYGKNTDIKKWQATGIPNLAKTYGLDWGGIFKGYPDAVHFYVSGIDTSKLYRLAVDQFKTSDPNKIIGNRLLLAQGTKKAPRGCFCNGRPCRC